MNRFDLAVIGAGSGGVRAARLAASHGWKVAVIEERFAGGTCVNVGCVPKKLMSYASGFAHQFSLAEDFGWRLPQAPRLSWETLKANRDREIARLQGIYRRLLDNHQVSWINGHARLLSNDTIVVDDQHIHADRILIATGSSAFVPDIPGKENLAISDDLFTLGKQPDSAIVWGGGYIASEFASILNGLGTAVTLIHRGPHILNRFDRESARFLHESLERQGINMRMNEQIEYVSRHDEQFEVKLSGGQLLQSGIVFCAIGRSPNITGLGLEKTGVKTNARGEIITNAHYETSVLGIYALGDVTGGSQLTPVALREAMNLIDHWFNQGKNPLPLELIPNAIFTHPCYASVGMSEEFARQHTSNLEIYRTAFRPMDHSLGAHPDKVLIKLLVNADNDGILGAHMVGEGAAEIVQGIAMAMASGATKSTLDATLGIHPTIAEEWVTLRTPS